MRTLKRVIQFVIIVITFSRCSNAFPGDDPNNYLLFLLVQNEVPRITYSFATNNITDETGGSVALQVSPLQEPVSDVFLPFYVDDGGEGTIGISELVFSAGDPSAHTITITGVDDTIRDGDVFYHIVFGEMLSEDRFFNGSIPDPITLINQDDDVGVLVVDADYAITTEGATSAVFNFTLNMAPNNAVNFSVSSSDLSEVTLSGGSFVLDAGNWNTGVSLTVTGVDDMTTDGDISVPVVIDALVSTDVRFTGYNPDDLTVVNVDDESGGFVYTGLSGVLNESDSVSGLTDTFDVNLSTSPSAAVTLCLESQDKCAVSVNSTGIYPPDGTCVSGSPYVIFDNTNWNTAVTISVSGVHDYSAGCSPPYVDNSQSTSINFNAVCSGCSADFDAFNGVKGAVQATVIDDMDFNTFISSNQHTGDFDHDSTLSGSVDGNGIPEADQFCNNSIPPSIGSGTFKAMIVDGINRNACTSANCTNSAQNKDWVFQADRYYYQTDGATLVFKSNTGGVFDFTFGALDKNFDFQNGGLSIWSGLAPDWTNPGNHCNFWSSSGSGNTGLIGLGDVTDQSAISSTTSTCDRFRNIICVEQ